MQTSTRLVLKVFLLSCLSTNLNLGLLYAQSQIDRLTACSNLSKRGNLSIIGNANYNATPPKVALTQISLMTPLIKPDTGLLVYRMAKAGDVVPGYYYWEGKKWGRLNTSEMGASQVVKLGDPIPAYTLGQLRSLTTPSIPTSYIFLAELGREGLFRYDAANTTDDDGAIVVVTSNGKRYKRVLSDNRITPQMFGAIPDDNGDDGTALSAWINYAGSYEHYLPAGTFLSSVSLARINKKGFTLKGAGQGKAFIQFTNDTHGIRVENILNKGAYGQITISDFEINSIGAKSEGKEAIYINSEHEQKPGPSISNLVIRATGNARNQWTTGLRYHNTSGSNTYGLSVMGIDLTTTTALVFSVDANRPSVEHNVTNFNIQTVKKGVDLNTPPTGIRTIEGIQFTDGSIVGAAQGIVGVTAIRQRSPYLGFNNLHINTFGGEAIYLDGYVQLVFSKCLFYSNVSASGVIPARSVYIANSIFCKGDFDLHLTGNLPAGAEFKGTGGGLDMRINGSHSSAQTYFVKQDATFPGVVDVARIWTGTTSGPPVDKLIVVDNRGRARSSISNVSFAGDLTLASANSRMINFTGFTNGHTIGLSLDTYLKFTATFGSSWNLLSYHGLKVDNVSGTTNPALRVNNNSSSAPLLTAYNSTTTIVARIEDSGLFKYVHSSGSLSGTPSILSGTGAGIAAVVSIRNNDNDEAHQVTVTTGNAPGAGTLATITFAKSYAKPPVVVFSPASGIVPSGVVILANAETANTYVIYASGALAANTTYKWNIHVKE